VRLSRPVAKIPRVGIVFVIDDDASVREGLSSLIRSVDLQVETFASAKDYLRHKRPSIPACVVLDVRLPRLSGLDLQRQMAVANNHTPIIFITGHGDIPMTVHAMKAGAVEFLQKPFFEQELLGAIQQGIELDRVAQVQLYEAAELEARYHTLTSREREVMGLVIRGLLNKQVAGELGTSESTVENPARTRQAENAGPIAGRPCPSRRKAGVAALVASQLRIRTTRAPANT
jgi:FixJ family two-component response regulator